MTSFVIGVVGEISTGKSAFINSLLGYPVILSRLKRDTICCTEYLLDNNTQVYPKYKPSTESDELLQVSVPDTWHNSDYKVSVIDFPGLNDTKDFRSLFERYIKQCNLILFITNADRPLITESESGLLSYVKETVDRIATHITQLVIVANKFDNNDLELLELFSTITVSGIPKFRYSSFKVLWDKMSVGTAEQRSYRPDELFSSEWNKIKRIATTSDNNGDQDNLYGYITEFMQDYEKRNCWVRLAFAIKRTDVLEFTQVLDYIKNTLGDEAAAKAVYELFETVKKTVNGTSYKTVPLDYLCVVQGNSYEKIKTTAPVKVYISNKITRLVFAAAVTFGSNILSELTHWLHPMEKLYLACVHNIEPDWVGITDNIMACTYRLTAGNRNYVTDMSENERILQNIYSLLDLENYDNPKTWLIAYLINPLDVKRRLVLANPPLPLPTWITTNIMLVSKVYKNLPYTVENSNKFIMDLFNEDWLKKTIPRVINHSL